MVKLKDWRIILYAFMVVGIFGASVLVAFADEEDVLSENVITISANNTFIDDVYSIADTVSSNNSALSDLGESVSSNNSAILALSDTVSANNTVLTAQLNAIEQQLNVMLTASAPTFYAYQLTDYYKNYFTGILENKPRTNYLAFALPKTHWNGSYNYSITHYYLVYDIQRDYQSGEPVLGSYPCYDCYTENGSYKQDEYNYSLSSLPASGYGSFNDYSSLIDYSFDWRMFTAILASMIIVMILAKRRN